MHQGDGIKKTYREKTELDRNIECKGAYSVAEFVFYGKNWMEEIQMSTVNLKNKTILVTGAAGFIGSNLVKRIYEEVPSATVIGIDNMNAYYDVALKEFRLNELAKYPAFTFVKGNIADKALITDLFEKYKPAVVVNLAAQAGRPFQVLCKR